MRITLAQLNPTIGDIDGNLAKLFDVCEKAKTSNSDLIVTSELYLSGYPPRDFLERNWFLAQIESAIEKVKKYTKDNKVSILLGTPVRHENIIGRGLYNSALLIDGGQIVFEQHKSLLPSYDVFDEVRYFDSAPSVDVIDFKGVTLGISICEDAWNYPEIWKESSIYHFDPIEDLMKKKADVLINMSASPFQISKYNVRVELLKKHVEKFHVPFVYVNQVGSNDELVFDGNSMVLNEKGVKIAQLEAFTEDVVTIDTNSEDLVSEDEINDIQLVHDALVLGIKDYFRKCGFSKAVIGLSGGIDSALTCVLAVEALGKNNVLGISMPSQYSSKGSVTDSELLAQKLGIEMHTISIKDTFCSYKDMLKPYFKGLEENVAEENLQARTRGNILMAFSNKFGHIVLSTGNKSEMSMGYCTLYGDMSGGLSVLSDVPKTLVYDISRYINRNEEIIPDGTITKPPSAELRPDQKDEDSLPPYDILDGILALYVEEGMSITDIINKGYEKETVKKVIRTVLRSEYKRRQAAPGIRVTSKAFGIGRRIPIAARGEI